MRTNRELPKFNLGDLCGSFLVLGQEIMKADKKAMRRYHGSGRASNTHGVSSWFFGSKVHGVHLFMSAAVTLVWIGAGS